MLADSVLYASVTELAQQIRSKKLTSVELTEAYLARSETIGARLNAYATLTRDLALKQAQQADSEIKAGKYRGPLHGIPYAAKDLMAVKGYPTSWGARPYANQKFGADATVIQKLRQAGAVLLGKAAMIELAGGMGYRFGTASISGPARNPWNESCWTCGSSSGSGAIVAAGLAAFSIGSETWGSIICPSAYTGCSGLRPTYGRVSRHGAMALSYSMDKLGPIARSAEDCGLILAAIAGHDLQDPASLPASQAAFVYSPRAAKPLRIGWLTNQWKDYAPGVESAVRDAVAVVKKNGARVQDASLPEGPWEPAAGMVISVEVANAFGELIESGRVAELVDPLGKIGGYVSQQIDASDYLRSQRVRRVLQKKMDQLFSDFDVLAAASLPVPATKVEANLEQELSFSDPLGGIGNLCGLPGISVPCGFTPEKLPVGLQFVGRPLDEQSVLAAGNLFQKNTDWHKRHPALA
jgi:Asp-tRNA(Asn)/Glu-tRNA(Gln) amidotransferase A subunit family amidase